MPAKRNPPWARRPCASACRSRSSAIPWEPRLPSKVTELFVGEDHITEIGSWSDTDAQGTVVDHGTYFSIFKKSGDKWLCIRDISVSAKPKEAAVAML
jgi:hypothetical protein